VHDAGEEVADDLAARIVEALCRPFTIEGRQLEIGASVGVATATVAAFDADELLAIADAALYEAKDAGRNRWLRLHRAP
jgi:GGDEF domain-containing protein